MSSRAARILALLLVAGLLGACAGRTSGLRFEGGRDPVYPPTAQAQGIEGWVEVIYTVTAEGQVINAVVTASAPAGVFDQAALAAVSSWRYGPAMRDGEAVAVENVTSRVEFRLGEAWNEL